ncbi:hypothetical protein JCM16303_004147 [Sporobolomyces ruberrimus]
MQLSTPTQTDTGPRHDSTPAHLTTEGDQPPRFCANTLPSNYPFDSSLSVDENYMVLTLIYARLSMSKRGNMACIIVDPSEPPETSATSAEADTSEPPAKRPRTSSSRPHHSASYTSYPGRILSHSNNTPQPHTVAVAVPQKAGSKGKQPAKPKPGQTNFLIKASQFPELHAEARSICLAASEGISLGGSTAYVSFPPCAACLPLLVASRVKRLVYRQTLGTVSSVELCRREGIECVEITDKELDERLKEKANKWWKEQGEGKDETRKRLERWWAEQETEIMGDLYEKARVEGILRPKEDSVELSEGKATSGEAVDLEGSSCKP